MNRTAGLLCALVITAAALLGASACSTSGDGLGVGGAAGTSAGGGAGHAGGAGQIDGGAAGRDAGAPDGPPASPDLARDLAPDVPPPSLSVGKSCQGDGECPGAGTICLDENFGFPADGYCTMIDCENDADCGGDAFCSPPIGDGGAKICFKKCDNNNPCTGNRQCSQRLSAVLDLGQNACVPAKPTANDGDPCATFGDCQASQLCGNNPFSGPGGFCATFGCTPGNDATCASGATKAFCVPAAPNFGFCLKKCAQPTDCRMAEGYACIDNDPQDAIPSLCQYDAKSVGAACNGTNADCGPEPWECLTGARFPGGYCGGKGCDLNPENEATCPFDSTCYDPSAQVNDQYCVRRCMIDAECRMNEGYRCLPITANPNGPRGCRLP